MPPAGESVVFRFLADGAEMAGDEPNSDGVDVFGVEAWDGVLGGCALPVKLLARAEGEGRRRNIRLFYLQYCAIVRLCKVAA